MGNAAPTRARFQMTDCSGNSRKWRDHMGMAGIGAVEGKKPKCAPEGGITSLPTIKVPNGNVGKSAKVVAELLGAVTAREIRTRLLPFGRPPPPERTFWSRSS